MHSLGVVHNATLSNHQLHSEALPFISHIERTQELEQSYKLPDGEVIIIGLWLSYYGLIETPDARAKPVTNAMDNVDKCAHLAKLYHVDGLATIFSEQSVAISSSLLLRFCGVTTFRRICYTATKREIELCVC